MTASLPAPSSRASSTGAHARHVVLVRHGETEWSRITRHTGRSDVPLDPEGEAQARRLGPRLREWRFAEVLYSPLQRARRTCELAGLAAGARPDPDLQEWDYGDYEGRTADEIRAGRPGWAIWRDGVVGGETVADVGRRADAVIERVLAVEGDVALFAHGHLLRILAARWCRLPAVTGERLALSPASVSVLGYERESSVIALWNDTSHLTAGPSAR
ncbi:MAG: histidine phosphatase family protein [Candidatus Dormibacteria bacterium]